MCSVVVVVVEREIPEIYIYIYIGTTLIEEFLLLARARANDRHLRVATRSRA